MPSVSALDFFLPTYESFDHAKVYVRSLWTVSAVSVTATRSRAYLRFRIIVSRR